MSTELVHRKSSSFFMNPILRHIMKIFNYLSNDRSRMESKILILRIVELVTCDII